LRSVKRPMARAPGEWPWVPADEDSRLCRDLGLPGAGDGNRTRTISLGICTVRASTGPDLRCEVSASDRERPPVTGPNGPLMARLSSVDLAQRSGLTSRSAVNPTALAARGAVVSIGPSSTNVFDGSAVNDAARW
jgi:hypothetical protein